MACAHSYLLVPGSSADGGAMRPSVDRFCGGKLSFSHGDIRSRPIVGEHPFSLSVVNFPTQTQTLAKAICGTYSTKN
jgi:hypothetical protein